MESSCLLCVKEVLPKIVGLGIPDVPKNTPFRQLLISEPLETREESAPPIREGPLRLNSPDR